MTAWLTYERDFAQRWRPVVIYGDKPKSRDGAPVWPVPADMIDADGAPHFGALKAAFPAPASVMLDDLLEALDD